MMSKILLLLVTGLSCLVNFIFTASYTCDPSISCGCSAPSIDVTARIVGGELALNGTWGWAASFQMEKQHVCGAILISPTFALTAAHCVITILNKVSIVSLVVGTNYLNSIANEAIQRKSILKITVHPDYNPIGQINDLALLQFSPLPISSDSDLGFICLPDENQDSFEEGTDLIAIGWGYTSSGSGQISNSLQQVTVQALPSDSTACLNANRTSTKTQFCAGTAAGGKDTCQGDSGGPLMVNVDDKWILAGITSRGKFCANKNYAGVYTRVSAYISYIQSVMNSPVSENMTNEITTTAPASTNGSNNNRNIMDKSLLISMFYLLSVIIQFDLFFFCQI